MGLVTLNQGGSMFDNDVQFLEFWFLDENGVAYLDVCRAMGWREDK